MMIPRHTQNNNQQEVLLEQQNLDIQRPLDRNQDGNMLVEELHGNTLVDDEVADPRRHNYLLSGPLQEEAEVNGHQHNVYETILSRDPGPMLGLHALVNVVAQKQATPMEQYRQEHLEMIRDSLHVSNGVSMFDNQQKSMLSSYTSKYSKSVFAPARQTQAQDGHYYSKGTSVSPTDFLRKSSNESATIFKESRSQTRIDFKNNNEHSSGNNLVLVHNCQPSQHNNDNSDSEQPQILNIQHTRNVAIPMSKANTKPKLQSNAQSRATP